MEVYWLMGLMVGGLMFLCIILILIYASGYKRVPPDSAMVIYGKGASENKDGMTIITGGGKFILPVVQSYSFLSLRINNFEAIALDIPVKSPLDGLMVILKVSYTVSVPKEPEHLKNAATTIIGKKDAEIGDIANTVLISNIRKICLNRDIHWIDGEREEIEMRIKDSANQELLHYGLEVRSLFIKDMIDSYGYLKAVREKHGHVNEERMKDLGLA